jgi:hypothetical protein
MGTLFPVRSATFMVDEKYFLDPMQPLGCFGLLRHRFDIKCAACQSHPVVVARSQSLFQPIVQKFLQTEIHAVDDYCIAHIVRHAMFFSFPKLENLSGNPF